MTAALPPPIDVTALLVRWSLSPTAVLGCAAAAAWWIAMARRAARAGSPVTRGRSVAFLAGIGMVLLALASPIDTYADVSFTVHMVQHLLLTLLAPPLLALGAPVALALRVSSPATRRRLSAALRTTIVRTVANPFLGFAAFAGVPFALHFSPVYDLALRNAWVHVGEHVVLLGSGVVYWWPLVGGDPVPHRPPHGARVLSMMAMLPAQSFLALGIFSASAPLYGTYARVSPLLGIDPLADQRGAAALMWVIGAVLVISYALATASSWRRSDEARQQVRDRVADQRGAMRGRPGQGSVA